VAYDPNWHDPAHVLVSIFAGRQPKPSGAFLTQSGHSGFTTRRGPRAKATPEKIVALSDNEAK
jgi:hypothetical protein